MRGTELVGAGGGIHQTAGDNDVVEHLPAVAVGVGAQAVTEELPHRIVEVGAGEFLGFRLGAHLLHDALGGRVVVEVAHVDEFGVWTGVQHGIGDATAQLAGGHTPRKAALLTARFGRPVVNHNVKRVNTIQNAGHQPLVAGDEIGVVGHNRRESPRAENLETGSIIEESHVDTAAIRRLVMAYRQMVRGQVFRGDQVEQHLLVFDFGNAEHHQTAVQLRNLRNDQGEISKFGLVTFRTPSIVVVRKKLFVVLQRIINRIKKVFNIIKSDNSLIARRLSHHATNGYRQQQGQKMSSHIQNHKTCKNTKIVITVFIPTSPTPKILTPNGLHITLVQLYTRLTGVEPEQRYCMICTALVAAPLRRLSATTQRFRELGCEKSRRMRPTKTSSKPSAYFGIG